MDPLTHTAIGFTLGQAGLKRLTPNWAWVMFFAASVPDIDGLPFLPGNIEVLNWHRHFTHSFLFAPVMGLSVVLGARYVLRRKIDFRGAWILATIAALVHDATDWLTVHGPRLFLPFSDQHFAARIESFFDPVLFTLLATGLLMPMLSRLVTTEIGGKPASGLWTARIFLGLCLCWLAARSSFRDQALAELDSRIYDGLAPRRIEAIANMNPLRFSGLVDTGLQIKSLDVHLFEYFDPEAAETFFRPITNAASSRALEAAGQSKMAQTFLAWASWPRWHVTRYVGPAPWVITVEEVAMERIRTHPQVVIRLNEEFQIVEERYLRSRTFGGL